ncbi:MAG: hypothetical protein Q7S13_00645, partial [Candidatus Omnitrophota bacterium]|nr:hypothetical protein [Candidatus Omnitrophota bacterium]
LVSTKFHLQVSKSSVSSVLKGVHLSSGVGRRATQDRKQKKFKIPTQKKKEISEHMQKMALGQEPVLSKATISEKSVEHMAPSAEPVERVLANEDESEILEKEILVVPPVPSEKSPGIEAADPLREVSSLPPTQSSKDVFYQHVREIQAQRVAQQGKLYQGLGCIFLKAAEWEGNQRPWDQLFAKESGALSDNFSGTFSALAIEAFLTKEGASRKDMFKEGIFVLNDLDPAVPQAQHRFDQIAGLVIPEPVVWEYTDYLQQFFAQADLFRWELEDATEFYTDPGATSLDEQVSSGGLAFPLNKALTILSREIISNNHPLILCQAPGQQAIDACFDDFLGAFEGHSNKSIVALTVLNEHREEVAMFNIIPRRRRNFICGLWPHLKEFKELTKTVKWAAKQPFYVEHADRIVYYAATQTDYFASHLSENPRPMRLLTLWNDEQAEPCMSILCNDMDIEPQKILDLYTTRWPYLEKPALFKEAGEPLPLIQNADQHHSLESLAGKFGDLLHQYCLRKFFPSYRRLPSASLIENIYEMPGYVIKTPQSYQILLKTKGNAENRLEELKDAVQRLNEHGIETGEGKKVSILII